MEKELTIKVKELFGKEICQASDEEIYAALLKIVKEKSRKQNTMREKGNSIIFQQNSSLENSYPTT